MKKILMIALVLSLISCMDDYKEILNLMSSISRKNIEANAFKNNLTVSIIEFNPISYKVINENTYDSLNIDKILKVEDSYAKDMDIILKELKGNFESYVLHNNLEQPDMALIYKKRIDTGKLKFEKYLNKIKMLDREDSLITVGIKNRINPDELYEFKFFIKAIYTEINNPSKVNNLMDTLFFVFDKEYKIKELRNFYEKID